MRWVRIICTSDSASCSVAKRGKREREKKKNKKKKKRTYKKREEIALIVIASVKKKRLKKERGMKKRNDHTTHDRVSLLVLSVLCDMEASCRTCTMFQYQCFYLDLVHQVDMLHWYKIPCRCSISLFPSACTDYHSIRLLPISSCPPSPRCSTGSYSRQYS